MKSACLSKNPGKNFRLNKGEIRAGMDADLVVFDPFQSGVCRLPSDLKESHILNHQNLVGRVEMTILRGKFSYRSKEFKKRVGKLNYKGRVIKRNVVP